MIAQTQRTFETNGVTVIPFSIDTQNIGRVTQTLGESLYTDPLSFVREITSNGVDAVQRNGGGEVIVSLFKIDGSTSRMFSVRDTGTGMNPEQFKRFVAFGSSDKRTQSGELGYWGLGSKSPFAFTDSFMVQTISEGMKYVYTLTKVEEGYGYMLTLAEATTEKNGTTVFIIVPENSLNGVKDAIREDLLYFRNIIFNSDDPDLSDLNGTKILEFETFAYNPLENMPSFILGGVRYPINFRKIGMNPEFFPIIGIKIPMDGTIMPIPSREDLQYTEKSIVELKKLCNNAVTEIVNLAQKQFDDGYSNLEEYINVLTKWNLNSYFTLTFGEYELEVSTTFLKRNNFSLSAGKIGYKFDLAEVVSAIVQQYVYVGRISKDTGFVRVKKLFGRWASTNCLNVRFRNSGSEQRSVTSQNSLLVDCNKKRKTTSYIIQELIGDETFYVVEKIPQNLPAVLKWNISNAELVTFEKNIEKIMFGLHYSKVQVPDDWKSKTKDTTGQSNGNRLTGAITAYDVYGRRDTMTTEQFKSKFSLNGDLLLIYGKKDETSMYFSIPEKLIDRVYCYTFSDAGLKKLEKMEVNKISFQEYIKTQEFKDALRPYALRKEFAELVENIESYKYKEGQVAYQIFEVPSKSPISSSSLRDERIVMQFIETHKETFQFDLSEEQNIMADVRTKVEQAEKLVDIFNAVSLDTKIGKIMLEAYLGTVYPPNFVEKIMEKVKQRWN